MMVMMKWKNLFLHEVTKRFPFLSLYYLFPG